MAKSGLNAKKLLLDKGEKIGVYVAAGLMGLLLVMGVLSATDSQSPAALADEMKTKAQRIQGEINNPNATVNPLPDWNKAVDFKAVNRDQFPTPHLVFDPTAQPDTKRVNPFVLGVTEFEGDLIHGKVLAFDIVESTREGGVPEIGVLEADKQANDQKAPDLKKWATEFKNKRLNAYLRYQERMKKLGQNNPNGLPPGYPGAPGGPGGGPPGYPGNPMGGGPPGFPGPMGGGPPGMPGPMGMGPGNTPYMPGYPGYGSEYNPNAQRSSTKLRYYPLTDEKSLTGKRLAQTILPKRMIVVNATFPYREQLEEVRKALRLRDTAELFSTPDALPTFEGVNVQRRVLRPDPGKPAAEWKVVQDWADLDYVNAYRRAFSLRKVGDQPEDPQLQYVMLPLAYRLTVPLPALIGNQKYPEPTRLAALQGTIKKLVDSNKPVAPPSALADKLKGTDDIFNPQGGPATNVFGMPQEGISLPGYQGYNPMGMPKEDPNQANQFAQEPLENCLVRIVDVEVAPGYAYQYRFQVKMKNPNFGKKEEVSQPSDAAVESLKGPWTAMKPDEAVRVPEEAHLYAVEAKTQAEMKTGLDYHFPRLKKWLDDATDKRGPMPPLDLKDGQALLQVQRWLAEVPVNGKFREPVGDWVVGDLLVTRGEYVGGKVIVPLPLWSSEYGNFVLQDAEPTPKGKNAKARKGVLLDLSRPDLVVVDVEGGKVKAPGSPGAKNRVIEDESAHEVLILSADGSLQVRSSAIDRENPDRIRRENDWKQWVESVDKLTQKIEPGNNPMNPNSRFGEQ